MSGHENSQLVESIDQEAFEEIGAQDQQLKQTLIESVSINAASTVFESNPEESTELLFQAVNNKNEDASESFMLKLAISQIDSTSDLLSLQLRKEFENTDGTESDRRTSFTNLAYAAMNSFSGDRVYTSFSFNHLAGAVASGQVSPELLNETVTNLASSTGYTEERVKAFLEIVEERADSYNRDVQEQIKQLKGGILTRRGRRNQQLLKNLLSVETKEEVEDIAKDIVFDDRQLRYVKAALVEKIYLDDSQTATERHRMQERLQSIADVAANTFRSNPEEFITNHLISYNAGEWDLCADLVARQDLLGNLRVPAILRSIAVDEMFGEKATQLLIEVAHRNPDHTPIATTLGKMLSSQEVDEEQLLSLVERTLGGKEVAQKFIERISAETDLAPFTAVPFFQDQEKSSYALRLHEKFFEGEAKDAVDFLEKFNFRPPKGADEKFINDLKKIYIKQKGLELDDVLEKYGNVAFGGTGIFSYSQVTNLSPEQTAGLNRAVKFVLPALNELALQLPKEPSERCMIFSSLLLCYSANFMKPTYQMSQPYFVPSKEATGKISEFFTLKGNESLHKNHSNWMRPILRGLSDGHMPGSEVSLIFSNLPDKAVKTIINMKGSPWVDSPVATPEARKWVIDNFPLDLLRNVSTAQLDQPGELARVVIALSISKSADARGMLESIRYRLQKNIDQARAKYWGRRYANEEKYVPSNEPESYEEMFRRYEPIINQIDQELASPNTTSISS